MADSDQALIVDEEGLRRLRNMERKLQNVTGNGVTNGIDYITINPVFPRQPRVQAQNRHHPLKITGKFSSGSVGVYTCDAFLVGDIEKAQNETLAEADLGTKKTAAGVAWHLSEIGGYGAPLVAGQFVEGRFVLVNDAGEMVFMVGGTPPTYFPVKVEKTGGSDGTVSTAASWTYTVRDLAGNELGTSVAVSRPRPNGKMTFQSGSSGYGVAFWDGSTLVLWDAGEVETSIEACQPA